jgi:choline dehydrogenase-like flavoprotein
VSRDEDLPGDVTERAEVVVVGSGAGGAVVAAELAEAGLDVVLLEEGDHATRVPASAKPLARIGALYRDGGLTGAVGNTFIPVPLGRTVGGTTTINSGTCWRAPEDVLEAWEREHGIPKLAGGGLAPEYERVERALGVARVHEELLGPGARLVRRGAEALGLQTEPLPRNAVGCRGTGICAFGCPRHAKQSTDVSYVPRAIAAGARLHVRARVERVVADGGDVGGVLATRLDASGRPLGALVVRAPRVVIAAGALLTPLLLRRSGLAPRSSPIGRHLRLHPASRVVARFDEPVRAWEGVPQSLQVRDYEREGIVLQGIQVPPDLLAPTLPGVGRAHTERMAAVERMASFGALISDTSEGRVLGRSRPVPWYRMSERDVRKMQRAVALLSRIFFAAGAREVYPGVRQRPVLRSAEEADALERLPLRAADFELMAFHPMGTARMGSDPARSAVDPGGRLRGAPAVRVADASLFPSSSRLNPQLTIMALATRVARSLVEEAPRPAPRA